MLPLDGLHPRRFPIANVAPIAANFAVWGSSTSCRTSSRSSTAPVWRAPSTTPAMGPSRGRSACSRLCLCTAAEATSSATRSSSPSSARTSRTLTDAFDTRASRSPAGSSNDDANRSRCTSPLSRCSGSSPSASSRATSSTPTSGGQSGVAASRSRSPSWECHSADWRLSSRPHSTQRLRAIDVLVLGHEPPTEQPRRSPRLGRSG
jgi:hypothetical protein